MIKTSNWAYIHIPKTSGTNFIKRGENATGVTNISESYPNIHFVHQPLQWWLDNEVITDEIIITFVRNPFSRLVSMYNHIKRSNDSVLPPFEDFVLGDYITERNMRLVAAGVDWRIDWTQSKYIENDANCTIKYFKMESDLAEAEDFVKFEFTDTNINSGDYDDWQTYYTSPEVIAFVKDRYSDDFVNFGYSLIIE